LVGTKLDLEESEGRLDELRKRYPDEMVLGISVFSGVGLDDLSRAFAKLVNELDEAEAGRA
jgi:GTP-binding protein